MSALQRFRDWRHERYIRRLKCGAKAAARKRDRILARLYWQLLTRAVIGRSQSQQLRMERRFVEGLDETSRRVYDKHRVSAGGR